MVCVDPPLSASPLASSSGSALSPGQLVSGQLKFPPPSAIDPEQFPPVGLLATSAFFEGHSGKRVRDGAARPERGVRRERGIDDIERAVVEDGSAVAAACRVPGEGRIGDAK